MPVGAFSRCVPWGRYLLLLFASNHNPLDLIERDLIAAPVTEAGSPGRLMDGHLLGDLQPAAVLEVGRYPGGAEGVAADLGLDAGPGWPAGESSARHRTGAGDCRSARRCGP
jgi:hypothetical protein